MGPLEILNNLELPTFKAYFEFTLLLNFKGLQQYAFPDSITFCNFRVAAEDESETLAAHSAF